MSVSVPDLVARASGVTLNAVFRRAVRVYGDRVAVASADQTLTYRQLGVRANQLSNALSALGVGRGDRIAVLAETRPEYVETYLATASLGVAAVALNIRMHPDELAQCVGLAIPKLLLASGGLTQAAERFRAAVPSVQSWVCYDDCGDGWLDYRSIVDGAPHAEPEVAPDPEDIHNVLFTSGTTGRSKGAWSAPCPVASARRRRRLRRVHAAVPLRWRRAPLRDVHHGRDLRDAAQG